MIKEIGTWTKQISETRNFSFNYFTRRCPTVGVDWIGVPNIENFSFQKND